MKPLSLRAMLLAGAVLCTPLSVAHADPFEDCAVADDAELAAARGGYITADGVTFDLGAIISTYQNGDLALQTQLTWTPNGAMTSHTAGDSYAGAAQAALAAASALGSGGVAVTDPGGGTQIVHGVDGQSLRNLIVTSASDTAFSQDIQVTITLPGFEAMQGSLALDKLGIALGSDINLLLSAAGRL
jgi:hypothetical protein